MTRFRRGHSARCAVGFSLIELLVVLAVLGTLALMAMPLAELTVQRDREKDLKRALWEIRDAIDAYKRMGDAKEIAVSAGGSGYPPNLDALVNGVPTTKIDQPTWYFLRRIPRDPFAPEDVPAEKTWGLRSFQSPADRPATGADVFDVYSLSDKVGLNGIALKDW